jgi:hypothetical protein
MDYYKIGGLAVSAVFVLVGLFKIELIKELAKKFVSDKERINFASIVTLILISVIPSVLGFTFSSYDNPANNAEPSINSPKTNAEVILEGSKDALIIANEISTNVSEKRKKEDSIFKATRSERWVYQIGDWMSNDEAMMSLYQKINAIPNVCLFKNENNFFFFINDNKTKKELEDSLQDFKSRNGLIERISTVDLSGYCRNSKEKLVKTKSRKIGKRKEKIEIECYSIEK